MSTEAPLFSLTNQRFNVIILAGGLGTRLKPETDYIPKALVELGNQRAIDHFLKKMQFLADRFIIGVGYCADLLENYCKGKYAALNLLFSREEVSSMKGPGTSLMYALDYASCKLPTLVTFCDYLIEDQFSVDSDALGICKPLENEAVLDTYKTIVQVKQGAITDLIQNPDVSNLRQNGFTGIAILHNTKLLKSLVYSAATSKDPGVEIDYAFDVIRPYLQRVKTSPCFLSRIFEFGTEETLRRTKEYLNGRVQLH